MSQQRCVPSGLFCPPPLQSCSAAAASISCHPDITQHTCTGYSNIFSERLEEVSFFVKLNLTVMT